MKSVLYDLLFFNVEKLRSDLNSVCGGGAGNLSIPFAWSLLLKFFIPPVLLTMLFLKFMASSYGAYGGYPSWYQGWGLFISYVPWMMFAVGLLQPQLFDSLMPEGELALAVMIVDPNKDAKGKNVEQKDEEGSPRAEPTSASC